MNRMEDTFTLRDRVARALIRQEGFDPDDGDGLDAWLDHADAVLAALGLDDIEAAAHRAAEAWWNEEQEDEARAQQAEYGNAAGISIQADPFDVVGDRRCMWHLAVARCVLRAALTCSATPSTERGESADG